MAATTGLITVAEFEKIPNPAGGKYELRNGELIDVSFPPKLHHEICRALFLALYRLIGSLGYAGTELPFRPTQDYNEWAADVGWVINDRWTAVGGRQCLIGAPDLVIEVLSPSNTAMEMLDREEICLRNGAKQFWTVNIETKTVKVNGGPASGIYKPGDEIDMADFGGGKLPVSEIFG
ncbi:MAG: Uma2 family endonuclease [Acidobacteria bacterium]|nr:Uma2 family endonuclease [Acidobacteriota bacterium]